MWREAKLADWQGLLLKEVLQSGATLVLASDADGLLGDETVLQVLRKAGYQVITYEDPAAFRYDYECLYRPLWKRGSMPGVRLLIRVDGKDLDNLPYDLLQSGYRAEISLGKLFPCLSYPVVKQLPQIYFDRLGRAYFDAKPKSMGEGDTADFILSHVFQLISEIMGEPADLLKILLRIHYEKMELPPVLRDRVLTKLLGGGHFKVWPLALLFSNRDAFFTFLQERWPIFLDRICSADLSRSSRADYKFTVDGPRDLPLENKDVHVYLDNLFLEGLLRPVNYTGMRKKLAGPYKWARAGIISDSEDDNREDLELMLDNIEISLPGDNARYQDWLNFAGKWAHLNRLRFSISGLAGSPLETDILTYQSTVDESFSRWLLQGYPGLYNLPSITPVMLHHVTGAMVREHLESGCRVALLVLDGMSYDQWLVIKDVLQRTSMVMHMHESAVFAWVPTITSVSRQSLFSGKIPFHFPSSIRTTGKEQSLWQQFWSQHGLDSDAVAYLRGLGEDADLAAIEEVALAPGTRVLGLVVDKLDKIVHGNELGAAGVQLQVKQWAGTGYLEKMLTVLCKYSYKVFLTSDHGNIEATGCSRPQEGSIAESKGERVRIYNAEVLRSSVAEKFPGSIVWPNIGLPANFLPLIAPGRSAFITKGNKTVTHGGASLEELIIPLVQIDWRME